MVTASAGQLLLAFLAAMGIPGAIMGLMSQFGRPRRAYYGWMCPNCGGFRMALDPDTLELTVLEELPG